jgi:glycerol-3-phosphate acyltransferase PlsY
MTLLPWLIATYLVGAIPSSYLIARLVKGIDIRKHGSGNPGATNVYRVVGPVAGVITFILDCIKGFAPVFFSLRVFGGDESIAIATAVAAVLGHMYTVFLQFKGGKGVATGAGIFFALLPLPTLYAFILFWIILLTTGYVSLGSIVAAASLATFCWFTKIPHALSVFTTIVAAVIIIKHRTNIGKLIAGTENRFGKRRSQAHDNTALKR